MKSTNTISTADLLKLIKETPNFTAFSDQVPEVFSVCEPSQYLKQLLAVHGLSKQSVIQAANLERSYGYQIFKGRRNPNRDILLSIAIAMQLSLPEAQHLLMVFERGALYPKNKRDAAIIYSLYRRFSLFETEYLLDQVNEPTISLGKK